MAPRPIEGAGVNLSSVSDNSSRMCSVRNRASRPRASQGMRRGTSMRSSLPRSHGRMDRLLRMGLARLERMRGYDEVYQIR